MSAQRERMDAENPSLRPMREQGTAGVEAPLRTLSAEELRRQALTLPNLLTYLRFLAVPAFIWAFHAGRIDLALWLFVGAALTDGLDGLLARVLHQRTRLGGILDPIADKLLTLAAVATLVVAARLPAWVLGLVLLRDACIASAAILLRMAGRPVPADPTRLGKYSTFLLVIALGMSLGRAWLRTAAFDGYIAVFLVLATQCIVATLIQYFLRWRRLMQA
jgi:cardiolipin synthase